MEAKNLRIGNWVFGKPSGHGILKDYPNIPFQITAEGISQTSGGILKIQPIILTKEWLNNNGFKNDGYVWWNGLISIGDFANGFYYCPTSQVSLKRGIEIKYVHQLQNLYFALTGQEIKPL